MMAGRKETRLGRSLQCNPWQTMPPEILAEIMSFFQKNDFLNARRSCRHWENVSLQPQFWRERTFTIKGKGDKEEREIARYLQTFGGHLRKLTVTLTLTLRGEAIANAYNRRVLSSLQEVLNSKLQLQSIALKDWLWLNVPRFDNNTSVHLDTETILTALCNLLEHQEGLSVVDFENSYFSMNEGVKVLHSIVTARKLTTLRLRWFLIGDGFTDDAMPVFLETLGRLKNLKDIRLSYNYLDDTVLDKLTSTCPVLRKITLFVDEEALEFTHILPNWQKAVKKNPELCVWVKIDVYCTPFPYHSFLLPDMPLVGVSLDIVIFIQPDMFLDTVEREIGQATTAINPHRLKVVVWKCEESVRHVWNRPEPLVALVKACPSLRHLCLRMTLALNTLLQLAAAARAREGEEGEKGGPSVTRRLQIHVSDYDTAPERMRERVSAVNSDCAVHVWDGCEERPYQQAFV